MTTLRIAPLAACVAVIASCGTSDAPAAGANEAGAPPPGSAPSDAGAAVLADGAPAPPGPGAPPIDAGESDPPSNGATLTFQSIGAAGWFPSRRDPASGACDAYDANACCMTKEVITSDQLTPWDEELMMTLRGPMRVKQLVVYQPSDADPSHWSLVSTWDERQPSAPRGVAFDGNGTDKAGFAGSIGSECILTVSTDKPFTCGAGSVPYCPPAASGHHDYLGWAGSKLFVLLASMPHAAEVPSACSTGTSGNWYDAPWIGLGLGELARAGAFASCHCFAKDPAQWALADGCGQFNVFEVVNDNNANKNLDVFSTDMIDYAGYVGEGPCGPKCNVSALGPEVDLIDKTTSAEAAHGAVSTPTKGPGAAFRRPEAGYRYFLVLMDIGTRSIQLAMVHPLKIPAAMAPLLPALPGAIPRASIDAILAARLPH